MVSYPITDGADTSTTSMRQHEALAGLILNPQTLETHLMNTPSVQHAKHPAHLTIPLVGAGFRPPARQIISVLPIGTPLLVHHDLNNEYDSNAVAVHVDMSQYPTSKMYLLIDILAPTSFDASELCAKGPLMLGYLASSANPKSTRGGPGNAEALKFADEHGNGWG